MVINGNLMVIYGNLMVINWNLMVMQNTGFTVSGNCLQFATWDMAQSKVSFPIHSMMFFQFVI